MRVHAWHHAGYFLDIYTRGTRVEVAPWRYCTIINVHVYSHVYIYIYMYMYIHA